MPHTLLNLEICHFILSWVANGFLGKFCCLYFVWDGVSYTPQVGLLPSILGGAELQFWVTTLFLTYFYIKWNTSFSLCTKSVCFELRLSGVFSLNCRFLTQRIGLFCSLALSITFFLVPRCHSNSWESLSPK